MLFKQGVSSKDVKWTLWLAMGVAHGVTRALARKDAIITSINDGHHSARVRCPAHGEVLVAKVSREDYERGDFPCPRCGKSCPISRAPHAQGDAFDLRVFHLSRDEREGVRAMLRYVLEPMGYIIISDDSPTPAIADMHRDHEHVEYRPSAGKVTVRVAG